MVVAASSLSCATYLDGLVDVSHGICFYVGVLLCGSHQFGKRREQSFDAYPGHVFVLSRHQHCSVRPVGHRVSTISSSFCSPRSVADAQTSPHVSWCVHVVRVRGGSVVGFSCAPFPDLVSTLAASTTMVSRPPLLFPRTTSCASADRTVHVHVHVDARRADGLRGASPAKPKHPTNVSIPLAIRKKDPEKNRGGAAKRSRWGSRGRCGVCLADRTPRGLGEDRRGVSAKVGCVCTGRWRTCGDDEAGSKRTALPQQRRLSRAHGRGIGTEERTWQRRGEKRKKKRTRNVEGRGDADGDARRTTGRRRTCSTKSCPPCWWNGSRT